MQLIRGKQSKAIKCLIYGPEGIGKTYFASRFPNPVFIDTEGGTNHMDVVRTPKPANWTMLLDQVKYFKVNPLACDTLVIDTVDWAEQLCSAHICAKANMSGIESFNYGKGYTYLAEEFGRLLRTLQEIVDLGTNVVLVGHAAMRKFEQPDEMGSYDRWELKLQKKVAPLCKEWVDLLLFANYKTYVIKTDDNSIKAQGGKRVMYTTHHPCWDAKNRHDLLEELPFDYDEIKHTILPRDGSPAPIPKPQPEAPIEQQFEQMINQPTPPTDEQLWGDVTKEVRNDNTPQPRRQQPSNPLAHLPKPLADLMTQNSVVETEITRAVASRGYYPADTPIRNYDPGFVQGVLIGAWDQIYKVVQEQRDIPL